MMMMMMMMMRTMMMMTMMTYRGDQVSGGCRGPLVIGRPALTNPDLKHDQANGHDDDYGHDIDDQDVRDDDDDHIVS